MQIIKVVFMLSSPVPFHLSSFLCTLLLNTLSLCSSRSVRDEAKTPKQNNIQNYSSVYFNPYIFG
jgi:hypothetical protein